MAKSGDNAAGSSTDTGPQRAPQANTGKSGEADKGRAVPLTTAAIPSGATPGYLIEQVAYKIKEIMTKPDGKFAELLLVMSELNESQLGQIPTDLITGGTYMDNLPHGMGSEIAVDPISCVEYGLTLGEANPNAELTVKYGAAVYDFMARNVHSLVSFLDAPVTQKITVNIVLTLLSHACFRDSFSPGALVGLSQDGYILRVTGGQVKIVNTIGMGGPVFLPMAFKGRPKLKQNLIKTEMEQDEGTAGRIKNMTVCISLNENTYKCEALKEVRSCYNQMVTNGKAANCKAQRKFIYGIVTSICSKLFYEIPDIGGDVYNVAGKGQDGTRDFKGMLGAGETPGQDGAPSLKKRK